MYVAVGWTSTVVVEWGRREIKKRRARGGGVDPVYVQQFPVATSPHASEAKTVDRVLWRLLPVELLLRYSLLLTYSLESL
jgi:hypothetical protein